MANLSDNEEIDVTDEFLPPVYVQLARIYDLMAVVALKLDPDRAEEVLNLHEQGKFFGAPPAISEEAYED